MGDFSNGEIVKRLARMERKINYLKIAIGRIEKRQIQDGNDYEISKAEFQVFSQWGEDGIIQFLINNIDISKKVFVEFGVENYTESNTRFLLMNNNWSGMVIDGNPENIDFIKRDEIYWKFNLKAECAFVTCDNINQLLKNNGIGGKIGLLSIDIDGVDYWIWKAIDVVDPDIVVCEYNHRFGKKEALTVPYDSKFNRTEKHYSNIYYGASIRALILLGEEKGYSLVGGNSNGNNIFFVKNNLLNAKVRKCSVDDAYVVAKIRESRDLDGKLTFMDEKEEKVLLKNLPLIDLENNFNIKMGKSGKDGTV